MLNILVAHPKLEEAKKICDFFTSISFKGHPADNGVSVQKLLYQNKFYAAVLNLDIKNHSGYEVLNYIKSNSPSLRLIITCGPDNPLLKDDESLENLVKSGILGIWRPPHDLYELGKIIDSHQNLSYILDKITKKEGQSSEENIEAKDDQFTPIRIDDFFSGSVVLFDTFVKIGKDKFIKILHAGDAFSTERLKKYSLKTKELYFLTSDRRKYLKVLDTLLKKVITRHDIQDSTKINLMKNMAQKYIEEIESCGFAPQLLDMGKGLIISMVDTIKNSPNLAASLQHMKEFDPNMYSHAYLVGLFSSLIALQNHWSSPKTMESLAMAALFHDIGKTELPKEIADEPDPSKLTPEQYEQYKGHPLLVSRKLNDTKMVDTNVLQIIQQHHEYMDGTGFPKGLRGQKIHPLSRIMVLANDFCNFLIQKQLSPLEAVTLFLQNPAVKTRYDKQYVTNLCQIFADADKIERLKKQAEK